MNFPYNIIDMLNFLNRKSDIFVLYIQEKREISKLFWMNDFLHAEKYQ
jgi:hypothetical protein